MSGLTIDLNAAYRERGTRFRVYPQAPVLRSVTVPETVWVSPSPGSIGPGPADRQMYVVDALGKREPYEAPYLPPYEGQIHRPALPDEAGHFDHLLPGTREFEAAHMYAVIRRVLDVWEAYTGRAVRWHFESLFERLELIPCIEWDNAQSGFGFIESGYRNNTQGDVQLFCLNFDVLAHEIGHSIVYSEVGWPVPATETSQYFGFQESAADMTALIAVLHFDSVVDRLLSDTRGNLYVLNELNRIAELSEIEQIRVASNDRRMSHYASGWEKEHHLSQPLTGALFDILVEVFHEILLEDGLIDEGLAAAAYESVLPEREPERLQGHFDRAFAGRREEFRRALLEARDYVGTLLGLVWERLSPHHLTYADVGHAALDADLSLSGGRYRDGIFECFHWREIGSVLPGPRLSSDFGNGARSCR